MRSNSTTFLLSLLVLLLGLVAQQAQAQKIDIPTSGGTVPVPTTKAPTASPAGDGITTPTIPDDEDLPHHEEEEVNVVIDLKIAGASEDQVQAIASLMKHLQSKIPGKDNAHKVNCTVEWKGERKEKESDSDDAVITSPARRRLLRTYDFGVPPRALEPMSKTCTLQAGETYNITTITLHGAGDKGVVNAIWHVLMNSGGLVDADGNPIFAFICQSNVRMQSEAPPAEFQTMQADKGNDAAKIAAIAVPVTLVGVGLIGTAGFFAFKSMSVAAV